MIDFLFAEASDIAAFFALVMFIGFVLTLVPS